MGGSINIKRMYFPKWHVLIAKRYIRYISQISVTNLKSFLCTWICKWRRDDVQNRKSSDRKFQDKKSGTRTFQGRHFYYYLLSIDPIQANRGYGRRTSLLHQYLNLQCLGLALIILCQCSGR